MAVGELPAVAERTVPFSATAVPREAILARRKIYAANEVFQFYRDSALQDKLKIGDKGAAIGERVEAER